MTDLISQIRDFLLSDPQLSQKMERIELSDGQMLFQQGVSKDDSACLESEDANQSYQKLQIYCPKIALQLENADRTA